jgi:hypothetical protein
MVGLSLFLFQVSIAIASLILVHQAIDVATLYNANTNRIQSLIGVVFSLVIHEVSLDITGGSCASTKRQLSVADR